MHGKARTGSPVARAFCGSRHQSPAALRRGPRLPERREKPERFPGTWKSQRAARASYLCLASPARPGVSERANAVKCKDPELQPRTRGRRRLLLSTSAARSVLQNRTLGEPIKGPLLFGRPRRRPSLSSFPASPKLAAPSLPGPPRARPASTTDREPLRGEGVA